MNGLFVYFNLYWPDIFLWMSGFLLSKSLIRNSIRRKEMIKEFGLYFIRIYPVYLIGLLVYSELSPHLSGGAKSAGLIR